MNNQHINQMESKKENERLERPSQANEAYSTVKQANTSRKVVSDVSIIKEEWLAERVYFGINTHIYVGKLRAFKLGAYKEPGIEKISDLAVHLFENEHISKHGKKGYTPLKFNSLETELRKVWAVIKVEDTENIDPYGYDVKINP